MRLIGREKLTNLKGTSDEADTWITVWVAEVSQAYWAAPADLLNQFPNAQDIGGDIFRFKIGDADLTLDVQISFVHKIAFILHLFK